MSATEQLIFCQGHRPEQMVTRSRIKLLCHFYFFDMIRNKEQKEKEQTGMYAFLRM